MTDREIIQALESQKEDMVCAVVDEDRRTHFVTNEAVLALITRQQAELKELKEVYHTTKLGWATARADAIKEFAERLKVKQAFHYCVNGETIEITDMINATIDNLVKEMVGK